MPDELAPNGSLWGANLASQPKTGRYLIAALGRGVKVVTIDVHDTEAAGPSDAEMRILPGIDAALVLAIMVEFDAKRARELGPPLPW